MSRVIHATQPAKASPTRTVGKKASAQTAAILSHLVQQPRGRRIAALLRS